MTKNSLVSYKEAFLIPIILLLSLVSVIAEKDFTGKDILSVKILYTGAKTVDEASILDLMAVRSKQKFNADNLTLDINSLIDSGLIDDVQMDVEERGSGVDLVVKVFTRPILTGVGFEGNTFFSSKLLTKEAELKNGELISDSAIFLALENLTDYYLISGYPDVVVSHRIQKTAKPEYAELVFTIDEGQKTEKRNSPLDKEIKSQVHHIKFVGNESFNDNVLKSEMRTKEKGIFSFLTKSGNIDVNHLKEDETRILNFYRKKGYLEVMSRGFRREPNKRGGVDLVMKIDEGQKFLVQQVALGGKMTVFSPEELAPVLRMHSGSELSLEKVRGDIRTIRSYYGSRGYADASVKPDIIESGSGLINLTYLISEGNPYKVGRVIIEGNTKTLDRVIRREIPLKPNDNFNTVDVETTRKRIRGLNYFSNIIVEGRDSEHEGYRDIVVKVKDISTGRMSFGIGFSSIDSVVGYMSVEETNFDISNPWDFKGAGQRFGFNLRLSSEIQDVSLRFTEPWLLDRRLSLGSELFYKGAKNLSDYYDQRNVGGAISLRKSLGNRSFINSSLSYEKIRVDVNSNLPETSLFNLANGRYTRPAMNLAYMYDGRDAAQITRRGHKVATGVTYVSESLGAERDSFIFTLSGRKFWNLWSDSILEVGGEMTTIETRGGPTPIYDRQFLGGYNNLRGFEYRNVGPRDPATGGTIGGDSMAYATIEWSVPLVSKVRGVVFYDAGFVNVDSWNFSPDAYHSDAGVGLRMKLPFGPIAVDYGFPLSTPDPQADQGPQFNFYVDYEF